jgi:hypothetical protein
MRKIKKIQWRKKKYGKETDNARNKRGCNNTERQKETLYTYTPNVVVEGCTLLLRIREIQGSDISPETACPD